MVAVQVFKETNPHYLGLVVHILTQVLKGPCPRDGDSVIHLVVITIFIFFVLITLLVLAFVLAFVPLYFSVFVVVFINAFRW